MTRRKCLFVLDAYSWDPDNWGMVPYFKQYYDVDVISWKQRTFAFTGHIPLRRIRTLAQRVGLVCKVLYLGPRYDLVISYMPPPGIVVAALVRAFRLRYPKIVLVSLIDYDRRGLLRFASGLIRWALPAVSAITVISEGIRQYYGNLYGPSVLNKVHVLGDFIEVPTRIESHRDDEPYVFSGGRSLRDWQTLVEAIRLLPDIHFVVIGGPPDKSVLGIRWPSNVRFIYGTGSPEFFSWIARSQMVVLTFLHPDVAVGALLLASAQLAGKAIVCTRTLATEEYVEDGVDGLLVPPGNPAQIAYSVNLLLENENLRCQFEKKAAEKGDQYKVEHFGQRLKDIVDEL